MPMFLASMLIAIGAARAHAQEDPRKSQAEPTFQEAVKLHEQKRYSEAIERFQKAYVIYPSPNTLVNIAREEQLLGRNLDALRHYREALKMPLLSPKSAVIAKQYVSELEPKLARVEVKGPPGTTLMLDGHPSVLPLDAPLDVEPGSVALEGRYGDAHYEGRAVAIAGRSVALEMTPVSTAPTVNASRATTDDPRPITPPPSVEDEHSFWTTPHTIALALGAVALVGAGAGIGFFAAREGHVDDQQRIASTNPNACADVESASCRDFHDAANGKSAAETGEWVCFGVASAFAIGAFAVWLGWPGQPSTKARAAVAPTGRGLSIAGTF
jgi:hypothetical protein